MNTEMHNPFENEERRAFRETIRRYVDSRIRPSADEWNYEGQSCAH